MPDTLAILVVDDEPDVARVLADLLLVDGHTVDIALSGTAALDLLRAAQSYDAVIADLLMPGVDGAQLYREVSRLRPELLRRFVFSTGDAEAAETLRRVGIGVVSKPFERAALVCVLQRITQT